MERCREIADIGHNDMQTTEQADMGQRLLDNDEQVLDEILRTLGSVILSVMSRRYRGILPETDIEDAVSIGLFRLWKNRRRFDSRKASLKVWFFRIVENAIRDVLRLGWHKARILEVHSDAALTGDTEQTAHSDSSGGCYSTDDAKRRADDSPTNLQLDLRDIVGGLPEKQRQIVLADSAARDGTASSQTLGRELDLPATTVRVYRKRAMDRIREELAERGHDVPVN